MREIAIARMLLPLCMSCPVDLMTISRGEPCVYTLLLESDRYYVGFTSDLWSRLLAHFMDRGARFTKAYRPMAILDVSFGSPQLEMQTTLNLMRQKGWWRVRGYRWSQRYLLSPLPQLC